MTTFWINIVFVFFRQMIGHDGYSGGHLFVLTFFLKMAAIFFNRFLARDQNLDQILDQHLFSFFVGPGSVFGMSVSLPPNIY